jgi:hypothetical protein
MTAHRLVIRLTFLGVLSAAAVGVRSPLAAAPAYAACLPSLRYHGITYMLHPTKQRLREQRALPPAWVTDCASGGQSPTAPPPTPPGRYVHVGRLVGVPARVAIAAPPQWVSAVHGVLVTAGFLPQIRRSPLFGKLVLARKPSPRRCGPVVVVQGTVTDWLFRTMTPVVTTAAGTQHQVVARSDAQVSAPTLAGQPHIAPGAQLSVTGRICPGSVAPVLATRIIVAQPRNATEPTCCQGASLRPHRDAGPRR